MVFAAIHLVCYSIALIYHMREAAPFVLGCLQTGRARNVGGDLRWSPEASGKRLYGTRQDVSHRDALSVILIVTYLYSA